MSPKLTKTTLQKFIIVKQLNPVNGEAKLHKQSTRGCVRVASSSSTASHLFVLSSSKQGWHLWLLLSKAPVNNQK
jgi:hypothetical protein